MISFNGTGKSVNSLSPFFCSTFQNQHTAFRQFALSVKFQFFNFYRPGDAVIRQVLLVCLARVPVKMVGIVN